MQETMETANGSQVICKRPEKGTLAVNLFEHNIT